MSLSPKTEGVSVVTTTWNERGNIEELIHRIRETMKGRKHEIIVVDDNSTDGTLEAAKKLADIVVSKVREGQTKGLLYGAKMATFPLIITIDSDLENNPELIPSLIDKLSQFDLVVASRPTLPRISEWWAAKTLGKICGVSDFYSNFRAYRREALPAELCSGETFGGELLIFAKKRRCKIGELKYDAPPRRSKPRIGGLLQANWRITVASWKCFVMYYFN